MKEYYVQGRGHTPIKTNVARKKSFSLVGEIKGQKQRASMQKTDFKKGNIYRKNCFLTKVDAFLMFVKIQKILAYVYLQTLIYKLPSEIYQG